MKNSGLCLFCAEGKAGHTNKAIHLGKCCPSFDEHYDYMNIGVVTGYDHAMFSIGELTSLRLMRYCGRNSYDCTVHRNAAFDTERPAPWSKVRMIQAAIRSGLYDWIFWIDADALVLGELKLESALADGKRLMLAHDQNGVNTGVMFIRADDYMMIFLERLYAQTDYLQHEWWEQAALGNMLEVNAHGIKEWTGFLDKKVWNSYPSRDTDEHSFITHVPGLPMKERLRLLTKYAYATA